MSTAQLAVDPPRLRPDAPVAPPKAPASPSISRLAGSPASASSLIDVGKLIAAYYDEVPDPTVASERVAFGTSGHRGSAADRSFNEWHVLAIVEAICRYRKAQDIGGPLYLGIDTHALSGPAGMSALEVLAANGVETMIATGDEYTPTPAVSHAILAFNRGGGPGNGSARADGIVVTPSHNPPRDGGIKYNPPHGGPAGGDVTRWIEDEANRLLETRLEGVRRMPHARALLAATTHRHDYLDAYVGDLGNAIDMQVIADSRIRLGVDPLGGAGVHYWSAIADRHGIDLTVVSTVVDPAFAFMTLDWDGKIRMDPSSPYAMQRLIELKDRFDVAFACDTDHDRHGIVTPSAGLLPANHYLSVAVDYLFSHRPLWKKAARVGKSVVTTRLIDLVAARKGRGVDDVPVGFKWFVDGLIDGTLAFACEESAGASFARYDGSVWTTDKDGITAALLAAEITARTGRDPGALYADLAADFGDPVASRVEAPATTVQKRRLASLSPADIHATELAGEAITQVLDAAPGNGAAIGGIKVVSEHGWFAARPSGTEDLYKIYAESFAGADHLQRILKEAQAIVDTAIAPAADAPG